MVTTMMIRNSRLRKLAPFPLGEGLGRGLAVLCGLLMFLSALPSHAATFTYSGTRRQIRACILWSNDTDNDGDFDQDNFAPYVFYILDRRTDIKPAGWEFLNPLAPSTISSTMYNRMVQRGNGVDPALNQGLARVNGPLNKNMAAYWEVNLDTVTATDLKQFDIILLPMSSNELLRFTPDRAAKLRQFVDGGGTLWLEIERGGGTQITQDFLISMGFISQSAPNTPATLAALHHPLVNYPYPISQVEAQSLGGNPGFYHTGVDANNNAAGFADPKILVPVVWTGDPSLQRPYVSAGDYGAGHLVVSSAGIAGAINFFVGGTFLPNYGGNAGAISGENLLASPMVDLKFAYNLVAWTSAVPTGNLNVRRTGVSTENMSSQLAVKFTAIPPSAAPSSTGSGAAIYKGVVFSVDGNNRLHAYNAHPGLDLDNKGNPDSGLPDLNLGAPYDEIWNFDLTQVTGISAGTRVSTPTVVSFFDTNLNPPAPHDLVVVTSSTGVTAAIEAFPRNANGQLAASTALVWSAFVETNGDAGANLTLPNGVPPPLPPAPALSEGVLFVSVKDSTNSPDTPWRIVALDPATGNSIFDGSQVHGSSNNTEVPTPQVFGAAVPGLSDPLGPLSVGYVTDNNTGAQDKMVYVPCAPQAGGGLTLKSAGYVNGVWFSTRHEPMNAVGGSNTQFRAQGQRGLVPWYAVAGANPLNPILHKVTTDPNTPGKITAITDLHYPGDFSVSYVSGPGINNGTSVTLTTALGTNETLFADYTVDWPAAEINNVQPQGNQSDLKWFSVVRRFAGFDPAALATPQTLVSPPALSRDNLLVFNTKLQQAADSSYLPDRVYGLREQFYLGPTGATTNLAQQNQIGTQVAWMFSPPDGTGATSGIPARLVATLPNGTSPVANNIVYNFRAVGSPAVSGDTVYVVGKGWQGAVNGANENAPDYIVILALKSNPTMSFPAGIDMTNVNPSQVILRQIDTSQASGTSSFIQLTYGVNFTVDTDSGTIHIIDAHPASSGTAGGDSFNTALPVYVDVAGTQSTTPVTNPKTGYGPLDNLLWFMVIPTSGVSNGTSFVVPPMFGGPASGPSVIGSSLFFGTMTGQVAAIDLPTSVSTGGQQELFARSSTNPGLYDFNQPYVHVQVAQTNTTNGNPLIQPIYNPPAGTSNLLAVGTPNGLSGLENEITLIADASRLLEVDTAGNAVWEMGGSNSTRIVGGPLIDPSTDPGQIVTQKVKLARPNVAYPTQLNNFTIVDTGNSRVLQVDLGGNVSLEIHAVQNDMRFLQPGEPLTLNQPTDVQSYTESGVGISLTNNETGVTFTYPGAYYATHNIIADSGNYRVLEVVSAYNAANGQPIVMTGSDGTSATMQQQVVFVTRSLQEQNQHFRYRTVQQFVDTSGATPQTYLIAAVNSESQAATNPNTQQVGIGADQNVPGQGGSLMAIWRNPTQAGVKDGDVAVIINSITLADPTGAILQDANGKPVHQPISNPTWFKEFQTGTYNSQTQQWGQVQIHYLLADDNGVYVLRPDPNNGAVVEWMLSSADYLRMTGRPLRAASIQRLTEADFDPTFNVFRPHYLITNKYSGTDSIMQTFGNPSNVTQNGEIHGEVFEVRSLDYYHGGYQTVGAALYAMNGALARNPQSAIVWMAPNETIPANGSTGPIKRSIGSTTTSTYTGVFDEPAFSSRPF